MIAPTPSLMVQAAVLNLLSAHSALSSTPARSPEEQRAMEAARKMLAAVGQAPIRDGWPAKVTPGPIGAPITHIG